MSTAGPLDALVEQAAAVRFDDLPEAVVELAEQATLDALGVAIAGSHEPVSASMRAAFVGTGDAGIWGTAHKADPVTAALVNGTAAHALDYDDWAPGSGAHPTVTILPALLAVAGAHALTGRELLQAYVAAYEFQERLGRAISPSHYDLGFHTTGIVGSFGAAVGATLALGGDAAAIRTAVKVVASQASGLKSMFGSMGKPLNAGNAAAAGIRAAMLATAGFVGPEADTVFGPQGFAPTHSTAVAVDELAKPFGEPWHIEQLLFKFFPSCFGTHATLLAAGQLRRRIAPADVRSIELVVPPIVLDVCAIPLPSTGLEGKFSLAYTAARGLQGEVGLAEFAEPFVPDPETVRLTSLVTLTIDESFRKTRTVMRVRDWQGGEMSEDADAGIQRWSRDPVEQRALIEQKFGDLVPERMRAEVGAAVAALRSDAPVSDLLSALVAPAEAAAGR